VRRAAAFRARAIRAVAPRPAIRAGLVLAAVAAALLAPAAASAAGGSGVVEPRLELRASNGYEVVVSGEGDVVTVGVSRVHSPPGSGAFTAYLARGHASAKGIEADFGSYGRVSIRFHAAPGPVQAGGPPDCAGTLAGTTRYGTFTGTIRFRGEGGYTAVDAKRAEGELVTPASNACAPVDGSLLTSMHTAFATIGVEAPFRSTLDANYKEGPGEAFFEAERGAYAGFVALQERTEGQIAIYNYAFAKAPGPSFSTSSKLTSARVTPPAPFSGSATLSRDAAGTRLWSGDLSVTFPGTGPVALAGPQFKTRLARSFP
jgi:hypothetical protein